MAAYSVTVTLEKDLLVAGRECREYSIVEANMAPTNEYSISVGWPLFTIVSCYCDRTAGTGTTVQPKFGSATGLAVPNYHGQIRTAADPVAVQTPLRCSGNVLFGRTIPNNPAADHAATTILRIVKGWVV
jgi:hypothetical protein